MLRECNVAWLIICVIISLLTAGGAQAIEKNGSDGYTHAITTARETLWKAIASGEGSGATVAIMDRGEIVYSEGIGVANRAENRPVDKETRFNIGSTSKMFAAVAVLLLVDEGKVALNESVTKYIPEFQMKDKRYRDITVRMLFNHSSGLPGSSGYMSYKADCDSHKLLFDGLKDAHLKHAPGAMSMYCNDGFSVAEVIVERVSGKKYLDFLAERIFKPLGMHHTSASVGEINETNIADYYDPKTGKRYPHEVLIAYASGGLSSTAEDLCRFGASFSLNGKRILSEASLEEILKTQPNRFSDKLRDRQMTSEFGWDYSRVSEYEAKGIQVLAKGGNTISYSTDFVIVPREGISIGLSITGLACGAELSRPILNALMKDRRLMEQEPMKVEKPVEPQPVPAGMFKYAGYYANQGDLAKIAFNKDRKSLTIYPMTGKKVSKEESSNRSLPFVYHEGYFHNKEKDLKCYFTTIDGKSYLVSHPTKLFDVDMLYYQKLDTVKNPTRLKGNVNGKAWLIRNASPYLEVIVTEQLLDISYAYKELPGYIYFLGVNKIENAGFASMVATAFRDQAELAFFDKDGRTWVRRVNFLFSTADGIGKVSPGTSSVQIGKDNHNEWLKVEKGALLRFEKPENGRVIVATPEAILFDSVLDADQMYAPAGSYVFCAGAAGDVFKIHAE